MTPQRRAGTAHRPITFTDVQRYLARKAVA